VTIRTPANLNSLNERIAFSSSAGTGDCAIALPESAIATSEAARQRFRATFLPWN
jgi:hypothetical protein